MVLAPKRVMSSTRIPLRSTLLLTLALSVSGPSTIRAQEGAYRDLRLAVDDVTNPDLALMPDGEGLIFTLLGHLYRISQDGGRAEQLTRGPFFHKEPAVSPDGSSIALVSDRHPAGDNVFILDLGSGELDAVTDEIEAGRPVWSPNGSRIAYLSFEKPRYIEPWYFFIPRLSHVRVLDLSSGAVETLTSEPANYHSVDFGADGTVYWARVEREGSGWCWGCASSFIEYRAADGTVAEYRALDGVVDHFVLDDDSGAVFYRAAAPGARTSSIHRSDDSGMPAAVYESDTAQRFYWGNTFAVAPGGEQLFVGDMGHLWQIDANRGTRFPVLFQADVEQTIARAATPPPLRRGPYGEAFAARSVLAPAISPDGSQLLFTAGGVLWRSSLEGPNAVPERMTDIGARDPAFSPDGSQFVYSQAGGDDGVDLVLQESEGRPEPRVLVSGNLFHPTWSHDGTEVVYAKGGGLEAVDTGTGAVRPVASGDFWYSPSVADDGSWIAASRQVGIDGQIWRFSAGLPEQAVSLTSLKMQARNARASADGRWLAFRRNADLWIADLPAALADDSVVTEDEVSPLAPGGGLGFSFVPGVDALVYARGSQVFRIAIPDGVPQEIPVSVTLNAVVRPPLVITNVRVLDPDGTAFSEAQDLFIGDGRIIGIGERPSGWSADDVMTLDAEGRFAIPGLWDSHVHNNDFGSFMGGYLASGITSLRDNGSPISGVLQQRDVEVTSDGRFPRSFSAGEIFEGREADYGDSWLRVADADDARSLVPLWEEFGARFIKIYRSVPWHLQRVIASEATRVGLPVAGHAMTHEEAVRSIGMGFRFLEHDPHPELWHGDILGLMAAAEIYWDPQFVERVNLARILARRDPSDFDNEMGRLLQRGIGPMAGGNESTGDVLGAWALQAGVLREAHERGVHLLLGTDLTGGRVGVHMEMEGFRDAGISQADILRMATLGSATAEGVDEDLGSLEVGKLADLLLLDEDPLIDLRRARLPWRVVKDGVVVHEREAVR